MSYFIRDISDVSPDEFPLYFFDCNVWIAQLSGDNNPIFEKYATFFEAVISLHNIRDEKLSKKIKNKPKIIVTSILLSEIFNAYMKQVAMKVYYKTLFTQDGQKSEKEINYYLKSQDFKKYRSTEDFGFKLSRLKSDFIAHLDYIEFQNDELINLDPISLIHSIGNTADFNDYFYYYSFSEKKIPIVTNDGDFNFQDIVIITDRKSLLKLSQ